MRLIEEIRGSSEAAEKDLESVHSLLTQAIDRLVHTTSALQEVRVRDLVEEIDLSMVWAIQEVIKGIPADYRNDPGNQPYFDKLDKILNSLAD